MPSLGADMAEGTLLEWLVKPGDQVHRGDVVAIVDTAKSAMDVEVFSDGIVDRLLVEPGQTVPVGSPLALLSGAPGEPVQPAIPTGPAPRAPTAPTAPEIPHASPPVRALAHRLGIDLSAVEGTGRSGAITRADVEAAARRKPSQPPSGPVRQRISPLARRVAGELGVDLTALAGLTGTGPGGAVTVADVRHAATEPPAVQPVAAAPAGPAEVQPQVDKSLAMRRAVGALMARSKREVPHYYLSTTIDLAPVVAMLTRLNAERPLSQRIVPAAALLKATALAAQQVPQLNGYWVDDAFAAADGVHLGVAVSLRQGGLIAPAIHDANLLSLPDTMAALRDLVGRARSGRLRRTEMTEGTLTVTNLGDRGVEAVFGVIYPPQVALVGFGRVLERPWASGGLLGVRPTVTATLSGDHRASDGHIGALFLTAVEQALTTPEEL
jgi:pyruvate dehydrogenase E2 component (dihydrolipoamide acetyltransferase)